MKYSSNSCICQKNEHDVTDVLQSGNLSEVLQSLYCIGILSLQFDASICSLCEQHAGQNIAKDSKSVINTVQACNKEASSKNHVTSNAVTNKEDDYPERLNPFSGDDDNDENSSNLVMSRGNKNKNSRLRSFIDKDYPEELNPFRNYPEELNPFRDHDDYPEELNPFRNDYPEELNPFGNDDPEELNPFKEDEMQINEAEGDLEKSCVAIDTMTKASTKKHMSLMSLVKRIANFLGF